MPPVWKIARWAVAVPVYGLVLANGGAFATAWGAWKLVSLFLPAKYYHIGDDFLFEKYQQLILFVLETVAGIQVTVDNFIDSFIEWEYPSNIFDILLKMCCFENYFVGVSSFQALSFA